MPQTINTNLLSLTAQRNLNTSQTSLATSMQRLSSGLRVNSAKDDAAGLAISERMNGQLRGLNVAARNANDGISLSQTAEGALGKVGDMLQRMRELAVQASNATNSQSDRDALNAEVTALKDEIARVASQTSFNGTKLLDGSFSSKQFQVGANAGEIITVSDIANATLAQLSGTTKIASPSVLATAITTPAVATSGVTIQGLDGSAIAIDDLAAVAGTTAAQRANQVVAAINEVTEKTGVSATFDGTSMKLHKTGGDIVIVGAVAATFGFAAGTIVATDSVGMSTLKVTEFGEAQTALVKIDKALTQVNTARANLGALQSRFENVVSNIQITSENVAAARGRIVDADFAAETANLSRSQILQQAGTAMVAQANALPQQVLQLLR